MIRRLIFVCVCLLCVCTDFAITKGFGNTASFKGNLPRAIVTPIKALFWFPIENTQRIWTWGGSDQGVCRYSWTVKVPMDNAEYHIAYTIFDQGIIIQKGTLADLISHGQTDLWHFDLKALSSRVIEGVHSVRAYAADGGLVIELTDKAWLKRLFNEIPTKIEFEMSGINQEHRTTSVAVEYSRSYRSAKKTK